ncbi:tail fiber protein [Candidatus Babeliales bacterium]|nr:tail fiber protein [Candidatus Babeliales bacterium]
MDIIKIFSGGFPLTKERLEFLQQTYTKAFSQLARLAGTGSIVLEGTVSDGTNVSSGIVIIGNEVLEFRGGAHDARVAIFEDVINVPYDEDLNGDGILDQKVADTVRYAKCAAADGEGAIIFDDLKRISSIENNTNKAGDIKESLNEVQNENWLLCDGTALNIADEPLLYAVLGVSFGDGGAGTFRLPNYQNKTSVGAGGDYALKEEGGEKETTLTELQMPAHSHGATSANSGNHRHGFNNDQAGGDGGSGYLVAGDANRNQDLSGAYTKYAGSHNHGITVSQAGGGQSQNNMMPFIAVNKYIFKGV